MTSFVTVTCIYSRSDKSMTNVMSCAKCCFYVRTIMWINVNCIFDIVLLCHFDHTCNHIVIVWSATVFCTDRNFSFCTIKSISNPTYGEMTITDGTNELYVYGTYGADGVARYSELEEKPYKGDQVLLYCTLQSFGGEPEVIDVTKIADDFSGHGGGDEGIIRDFISVLRDGGESRTSAATSLQSHLMCFAAERSRKENIVVAL